MLPGPLSADGLGGADFSTAESQVAGTIRTLRGQTSSASSNPEGMMDLLQGPVAVPPTPPRIDTVALASAAGNPTAGQQLPPPLTSPTWSDLPLKKQSRRARSPLGRASSRAPPLNYETLADEQYQSAPSHSPGFFSDEGRASSVDPNAIFCFPSPPNSLSKL